MRNLPNFSVASADKQCTSQMEELLALLRQSDSFPFLHKFENLDSLWKTASLQELDQFLAQFIRDLRNPNSADGLYKSNGLAKFTNFITRMLLKKYKREGLKLI